MAITKKQEKFAQEYIKDFNGVQAYLRAFPDAEYESAKTLSSRWLKDKELKEYIAKLVDDYVKEEVNPNRIIMELTEIAYDRSKPLSERNKALKMLASIYGMENMNLNVNANVNVNPYEELTTEELKKLAGIEEDD